MNQGNDSRRRPDDVRARILRSVQQPEIWATDIDGDRDPQLHLWDLPRHGRVNTPAARALLRATREEKR